MPQKRYRPEEIIARLRQAEVLIGQGKKVPEAVKATGHQEVGASRENVVVLTTMVDLSGQLSNVRPEVHRLFE